MTAIIVNDQGEVFIRWASACSIAENGWESYYSVPVFAKPTTVVYEENDLCPAGLERNKPYAFNQPHIFSDAKAAEKARFRMHSYHRTAVVT